MVDSDPGPPLYIFDRTIATVTADNSVTYRDGQVLLSLNQALLHIPRAMGYHDPWRPPMDDTTSAARIQTRRCTRCCLVKHMSEFRRRYAESEVRHTECRQCARERARLRRLKQRDRRLHDYSQKVKDRAHNAASVAALTAEMVRLYGGIDEFALAWKQAIDDAAVRGKSYLVVRGFDAVVRLAEANSELQKQDRRLELIDDRDLQRQLDAVATRVIAGNPELAISAARRLGWHLEPLEDVTSN